MSTSKKGAADTPPPPVYVNVNSHRLRANRKPGAVRKPPVVARTGRNGRPGSFWKLEILAADGTVAAEVEYAPGSPLKCGAEVFVVCPNGVRYVLHPRPDQAAPPAAARPAQSTRGRRARSAGATP